MRDHATYPPTFLTYLYFVRRDRRGYSYHEESVVLPVFVEEQRGPVLLVLEGVADVLGVLQADEKRSR